MCVVLGVLPEVVRRIRLEVLRTLLLQQEVALHILRLGVLHTVDRSIC
jgi:hypothetical protein